VPGARTRQLAISLSSLKHRTKHSPPVLHEASLTPIDENELG
jgi:hypothetical protein